MSCFHVLLRSCRACKYGGWICRNPVQMRIKPSKAAQQQSNIARSRSLVKRSVHVGLERERWRGSPIISGCRIPDLILQADCAKISVEGVLCSARSLCGTSNTRCLQYWNLHKWSVYKISARALLARSLQSVYWQDLGRRSPRGLVARSLYKHPRKGQMVIFQSKRSHLHTPARSNTQAFFNSGISLIVWGYVGHLYVM